jgi:hypothetical protein
MSSSNPTPAGRRSLDRALRDSERTFLVELGLQTQCHALPIGSFRRAAGAQARPVARLLEARQGRQRAWACAGPSPSSADMKTSPTPTGRRRGRKTQETLYLALTSRLPAGVVP